MIKARNNSFVTLTVRVIRDVLQVM